MTTQAQYAEAPRSDIFENENEYLLMLDVPGVALSNVSIQLHDQQLTIDGARDESFHYRRSFAVPALIQGYPLADPYLCPRAKCE